MDNNSLYRHDELAQIVQWQREEEAQRMRQIGAVEQPSLWARPRSAVQHRPEPREADSLPGQRLVSNR